MADSLCHRSFFSCKDNTLDVSNEAIKQSINVFGVQYKRHASLFWSAASILGSELQARLCYREQRTRLVQEFFKEKSELIMPPILLRLR